MLLTFILLTSYISCMAVKSILHRSSLQSQHSDDMSQLESGLRLLASLIAKALINSDLNQCKQTKPKEDNSSAAEERQ